VQEEKPEQILLVRANGEAIWIPACAGMTLFLALLTKIHAPLFLRRIFPLPQKLLCFPFPSASGEMRSMAEAVPLNIAQQPVQLVAPAATAPTAQPLPATILELPADFPAVTRPVQINGSLAQMLSDGQLTLRTSTGLFTLSLSGVQNLPATPAGELIRQSIAELLSPLIGTARTVTLSLQPSPDGSGKGVAFLIVPKTGSAAAPAPQKTEEVPRLPAKKPPLSPSRAKA
jgi:hypothetical protein